MDCIKATETWNSTFGSATPTTATFDQVRAAVAALLCPSGSGIDSCYEQTTATTPTYPPAGRTCSSNSPMAGCNAHTIINDTSSNQAGQEVVTRTLTSYPTTFEQTSALIYHLRACPSGYNAVTPDASKSLTLC